MFNSDLPSTVRAELDQLKTPVPAMDVQPHTPSSVEVTMDDTRRRLMLSLGLLGAGVATVPATVLAPVRAA
jgi:hypothetical protein